VAAQKALEWVEHSPLYRDMHCHVVHVSKGEAQADSLLKDASQRIAKAGLQVSTAKLHGNPQEQLLNYQQEHDIQMVVMGSFGHGRLREMLWGSFTSKMLHTAKIPLLLLR